MKILDLCCGAGLAAMGLHQSLEKHHISHSITGIDIKPHPEYPFTFIQGDALNLPMKIEDFDFLWASPPCQHWVDCAKKENWPDLIRPLRKQFQESHKPYVIENVRKSPLKYDLRLVGGTFGLPIRRVRHFECSFYVKQPSLKSNKKPQETLNSANRLKEDWKKGNANYSEYLKQFTIKVGVIHGREKYRLPLVKEAMGLPSDCNLTMDNIVEGIPPIFSEYIMDQFLLHRNTRKITLINYLGGARDAGART